MQEIDCHKSRTPKNCASKEPPPLTKSTSLIELEAKWAFRPTYQKLTLSENVEFYHDSDDGFTVKIMMFRKMPFKFPDCWNNFTVCRRPLVRSIRKTTCFFFHFSVTNSGYKWIVYEIN